MYLINAWKREPTKAEIHSRLVAALRLLEDIRGVLARCEWHESNGGETCPFCGGERPLSDGTQGAETNDQRGHAPNCRLAAHLRGE
jgi:hypothetical protein